MKGILLFTIALLSFFIIAPTSIIYAIYRGKGNFMNYAISLDQTINNLAGDLLCDLLLIDVNKYQFGDMDKTISYHLGENNEFNNLNSNGKMLVYFLDKIDKDHILKAYKGKV